MAERPPTSEYIDAIKQNAPAVLSGISELAKTQLKPSGKHAAIGGGAFGGAAGFAWMSLKFLAFGLVALASWLWSKTGWSTLFSVFMGFITMFVLGIVIAMVLALVIGRPHFKKVTPPKAALAELKATIGDVGTAAGAGVELAKAPPPKPVFTERSPVTRPTAHYVVDPIHAAKQRAAARAAAKAADSVEV